MTSCEIAATLSVLYSSNTLSFQGEGVVLAVDQVLYCKFQILHLAQQPKGQLWQSEWADKERNYQQDEAVLRGVCHQDGHTQ